MAIRMKVFTIADDNTDPNNSLEEQLATEINADLEPGEVIIHVEPLMAGAMKQSYRIWIQS